MNLINIYTELGRDFMRNFYKTGNQALSAYMGVTDGKFSDVFHKILDCVSDTAAAEMRASYKVGFRDGVALMREVQ